MRIALLIILSAFLLYGCNPVKKVLKNQQQFEQIGHAWAQKNPCANDSSIIYTPGVSDTIWPNIPPVYDTIYINDGTLSKPCVDRVSQAYLDGYSKAKTQYLKQPVFIKTVDTLKIYVRDGRTEQAIAFNYAELQKQLSDCQLSQSKQSGRLWLPWIVAGIAILLLILSIYFLIKK